MSGPPAPGGHRGRTVEHIARPRTAGIGLEVFAVEDRSAQAVCSSLEPGRFTVSVDGPRRRRPLTVDHPGG
ncbi:MAG TPA: hypothetical protein PKC57_11920, partial [Microthrixaceae bacterium]|nr:hypothetical protein [Microthrixaceae bacterium]